MRQLNLKLSEGDTDLSAEAEGDRFVAPAVEPVFEDAAPSTSLETHSIRALHDLIEQRMRAPREAPAEPEVATPSVVVPVTPPGAEAEKPDESASASSRLPIRILKISLGLAIVALFGWMPLQTLLQASSVEAIVNSRVVTVRAPIEGDVVAMPIAPAGILVRNQPLVRIENRRADRSRLDSLNDQLATAEMEKTALDAKIPATQRAYDVLVTEVAAFTAGRIKQLEARSASLAAEVSAAGAQRAFAESEARRATMLASSNTVSSAELERLTQLETVAVQTEIAAKRQLEAANVELDAARSGSFIGDSYNDMPSSAQRRDELRQRIDELTADRDAAVARIARIETARAEEAGRYRALSDVEIALPVSGRIWEVMTAPGEHVQAGQDLLKILDCSGAVVTANVTESVYNRLSVGSPARFRPTDGGPDFQGTVTNLTGLAEAAANLAIVPSALNRGAYRVTVRVPELASEPSCAIGRTGRVIFDKAPAGAQ